MWVVKQERTQVQKAYETKLVLIRKRNGLAKVYNSAALANDSHIGLAKGQTDFHRRSYEPTGGARLDRL